MLTDIPNAPCYYLSPLKNVDLNVISPTDQKIMEVGGQGVMNEVGALMNDKQVAMIMGITNDRCLLFVDITDVECVDIVSRARMNYDVKAGRVLDAGSTEVK